MLDPRLEIKNPVMFVVLIGTIVTFIESVAIRDLRLEHHVGCSSPHLRQLCEAVAEGRGKAQRHLRKMRPRPPLVAFGDRGTGTRGRQGAAEGRPRRGRAKRLIPSDGEIVEGIASVDESAITGVARDPGVGRLTVRAVTGAESALRPNRGAFHRPTGPHVPRRMIALVEGANRQKTPNEIALTILLAALTIIFLPVVVTAAAFRALRGSDRLGRHPHLPPRLLIPTTIGALLSRSASPAWTGWFSATCSP